MTRDEAIKIFEGLNERSTSYAEDFVDACVALGVVFDDPPSPLLRLIRELKGTAAESYGNIISDALDRAGLKVVDK